MLTSILLSIGLIMYTVIGVLTFKTIATCMVYDEKHKAWQTALLSSVWPAVLIGLILLFFNYRRIQDKKEEQKWAA